MFTATEAKLASYSKRSYFKIVENKIFEATNKGDTSCEIMMDEIPYGTPGTLCEISDLLNELGYQTLINENTISVYWTVQRPIIYDFDTFGEEDVDDIW